MAEVTCPRCKGSGDVPAPGGSGITKCFACGGHGVIDEKDLAWKSKWATTSKVPEQTGKKTTKMVKTAGATKAPRSKATKLAVAPRADRGRTPLHQEASDGFLRGVQDLLDQGIDANVRDDDGRTPLHWPAYRGHVDIVRLLIVHGADVNAADNNGRTPLKMAAIANRTEIIDLLKEHGALE
jgi:hypothetical protein